MTEWTDKEERELERALDLFFYGFRELKKAIAHVDGSDVELDSYTSLLFRAAENYVRKVSTPLCDCKRDQPTVP